MDRANALNMSSTSNMQPKMSSLFKLAYMLLFVLAPLGLTTIPVVLLFIDALVRRQTWPRGRLGFFGACLGLLLALLAASAVFSPRPLVAAATTSVFALVVGAVILPVARLVDGPGTGEFEVFLRKTALPLSAIGTVLMALVLLYQALVLHQPRALGFAGANGSGTTLILGTGLGLGWLLSAGRQRSWLVMPFAFLSLGAVIATMSRGAWIGFFVMLAILALRDRRILLAAMGVVAVFVVAVSVEPALSARFARIFQPELNLDRLQLWQTSLRMLADRPLLGFGAGVFPYVYPEYSAPGALYDQYAFAHNIFLQLALDGGIPTLAVFIALVVETVRRGMRLWRRAEPAFWGLLPAFAGVMVHQQVDLPVYGIHIGGGFWALAGLIAVLGDAQRLKVREN